MCNQTQATRDGFLHGSARLSVDCKRPFCAYTSQKREALAWRRFQTITKMIENSDFKSYAARAKRTTTSVLTTQ